jgi:hypothetical protein
VVVDAGPWVEELHRFLAPLGVRVLVDAGTEAQSRAATRSLGVRPATESAASTWA